MNSSEPAQLSGKFKEENLGEIIDLLARELRDYHSTPAQRSYDQLSEADQRRLRAVLDFHTPERMRKTEKIHRDYDSAQAIGRFIKWAWWGLAGFIGFVVGVVKMAPGVVDWLRGVLK